MSMIRVSVEFGTLDKQNSGCSLIYCCPRFTEPAIKLETIIVGYNSKPKPQKIFRTEIVNFRTAVRFRFQIFRTETATEPPFRTVPKP